jgi:DNA replication protein DnaC
METGIKKTTNRILSGLPPQLPESTTIFDEVEEAHEYAILEDGYILDKKRMDRENMIRRLGSIRACDLFTLERFLVNDKNTRALDSVKAWKFNTENIYIVGPVGCGKSHLQAIALRRLSEKTHVRFRKVTTICRSIRACDGAYQEQEIIDRLSSVNVLALDDLGQEKMTEFVISVLYEIIDGRYMNMPGGLIVTSNLTLNELSQKLGDDRIPSRLAQMCKVVSMAGEKDWRI